MLPSAVVVVEITLERVGGRFFAFALDDQDGDVPLLLGDGVVFEAVKMVDEIDLLHDLVGGQGAAGVGEVVGDTGGRGERKGGRKSKGGDSGPEGVVHSSSSLQSLDSGLQLPAPENDSAGLYSSRSQIPSFLVGTEPVPSGGLSTLFRNLRETCHKVATCSIRATWYIDDCQLNNFFMVNIGWGVATRERGGLVHQSGGVGGPAADAVMDQPG